MKIFTDLTQIVENKELISNRCEAGKWLSIEYTTKLGKGRLLASSENTYPQPLRLNLNLTGWYKIYIGMFNMRSKNYIYAKLSGDEDYCGLRHTGINAPASWCATEYMEEVFWKCADLTDQQFILAKPELFFKMISGISWIRCEEMTEDEVARYRASLEMPNKCIQMHYDCDALFQDDSIDRTLFFSQLHSLKNANVDFLSLEYSLLYDCTEDETYFPMFNCDQRIKLGRYQRSEDIMKDALAWAHENGIKLYATDRMCMASFEAPYFHMCWKKQFIEDHPQYYCRTRDGKVINMCSYAYKEVWDYMIGNMVRMAEIGFDGISMILNRGIHVAFEQPVLDRFAQLYPNVDPCTLPITDARLNGVWCEFMTAFMRILRAKLDATFDRHIELNAITAYSIEMAKRVGLDLEAWAKEGLVDSIAQADMEVYEELEGCMSDEDPSLIDLSKYSAEAQERTIVKRNYGSMEKNCKYVHEFVHLEETYGVKTYCVLPWGEKLPIDVYRGWVDKMEALGAKHFLAYNTNHILWVLPEFYTISHIGNDLGTDACLHKYYRVLSFDDSDISQFNPNWRG